MQICIYSTVYFFVTFILHYFFQNTGQSYFGFVYTKLADLFCIYVTHPGKIKMSSDFSAKKKKGWKILIFFHDHFMCILFVRFSVSLDVG